MLNVLDEFSHKCLAIRVARKLKAIDVIEVLSDLSILRGVLAHIRSDEGPEFVRQDHLHRRGGPWENGYIEKFNARLRDELLNGEIFYFARGVVVAQCRLAVSTALSHSRPTRAKIKRQTLTWDRQSEGGDHVTSNEVLCADHPGRAHHNYFVDRST
jgi:transposase InsO family protein